MKNWTNLPTAPCLIWWKTHLSHNWAYTSEGGGHMVEIGDTTARDYEEAFCPGLYYVGKHRGYASKWHIPPSHNPKHRG